MEKIRCGLTAEGHIEAAYYAPKGALISQVTIDRTTGRVVASTVRKGSDDFRRLVIAARAAMRANASPKDHYE